MNLLITRTDDRAHLPTRATEHAAGLDFRALNSTTIYVHQRVLVDTGIAVAIPHGYFGALHSRSGHGHKHGIGLSNGVGVIDSDFRGSLKVSLLNMGQQPYHIAAGERIAQLIIQPAILPGVTLVDELDGTVRGDGGFGSTGTK